jgi:chemotaxis signal transduction protein
MDLGHLSQYALAGEYLVFKIAEIEYAILLECVNEIRSHKRSQSKKETCGVRGITVTMIDLHLAWNPPHPPCDDYAIAIITYINNQNIGLLADSVSEVLELTAANIRCIQMNDNPAVVALSTINKRKIRLINVEAISDSY